MLLVPAVVSSEPAAPPTDTTALSDIGRGLVGLVDPDDVNTDGTLSEADQIGSDVLRDAADPGSLALDGLDLPTGPLGIPQVMMDAYKRAAATLAKSQPNCHLDWSLLASIGRIESNHGRGGQVFGNGDTVHPILGPVLNGGGFAAIADTDGGRYDSDSRWDRAVGVMQFIPSTWASYASDGNGDRVSNPHNIYDATLAAGKYLCSGGLDLANPQQRATAVFRYNHSDTYVRVVLIWADAYAKGVTPLPSTGIPPMQQAMNGPVSPIDPVVPGTPAAPGTPGTTTPPGTSPGTTTPPDSTSNPPPQCDTSTTTPTTTTPTTTPTTTTPDPCSTTKPNVPPTTTTTTTTTQAPSGGGETSTNGSTSTNGESSPSGGGESSTASSSLTSSSTEQSTTTEAPTSPLGP
jgi:hypothetical protein